MTWPGLPSPETAQRSLSRLDRRQFLVLRRAAPALCRYSETAQRSLSRLDRRRFLVLRRAAPALCRY
jgi:hypothetical protein